MAKKQGGDLSFRAIAAQNCSEKLLCGRKLPLECVKGADLSFRAVVAKNCSENCTEKHSEPELPRFTFCTQPALSLSWVGPICENTVAKIVESVGKRFHYS